MAASAAEIRAGLGHPVVDADGHFIETEPVLKKFVYEFVEQAGGRELAERARASGGFDYDDMVLRPWSRLGDAQRRAIWATRPPWWSLPTDTLDRATAHLPRLLYERLDELGIDFAVLYPSRGLTTTAIPDAELRQVACRALNSFYRELFGAYGDRMTPVAQIPTHTPEEAIAELEHAVCELGFKAIMINGLVHRPVLDESRAAAASAERPNWGSGSGERIDALGLDSAHDYDPFWRRCVELGVAPASHTPGMGWGSRRSVSSYMYNHMGSFAASMDAFCKALFMGGVTRRFPGLCFGLLEGGVGWACLLLADIVSHWEKRNAETIRTLDPARLDSDRLLELFREYGEGRLLEDLDGLAKSLTRLEPEPPVLDEWAACEITDEQDIYELFVKPFFFGCEADDRSVAWAFNDRLNPGGQKLRAMFSSDLGHWDVPAMSRILPEAFELLEEGHLSAEDFRDFTFGNPVRFYTSMNPDFFAGTHIEREAARVVAES